MSTNQSNLGEIFSSLVTQLGLDPESAEIKPILSNDSLKEVMLGEETANKFKTGFLTMNVAKNNSDLNKFFMSKHLTGVDQKLKTSLGAMGVPQELIDEASGIDSTIKRLEFILPKLQEHYKATYDKPANEGTKLKEVTDKYSALVAVNQELAKKLDSEKDNWHKEREQIEVNFERNNLLGGYTFGDVYKREDVEPVIVNKLNALPYVFRKKADGKTGVFQKDAPDLEATKDNKVLTMKDILDEVTLPYVKKSGKVGETPANGIVKKDVQEGAKLHPNAKAVSAEIEKFNKLIAGE